MKFLLTFALSFISIFSFAQTYLLDSSHHYFYIFNNQENFLNQYYTYDNFGVKTSYYSNSGNFDDEDKENYTYNNDGLLTKLRYENYNDEVLVTVRESYLTYNSNDDLLSDSTFEISGNNVLTFYESSTYTYDSQGRVSQLIFDDQTVKRQTTYYYTGNSTLRDSIIEETTTQSVHYVSYKFNLTYNSQGQLTNSLATYYYSPTGTNNIEYSYDYTYDTNGNILNTLVKTKNNGVWELTYQTNYGYNINNLIEKEVLYSFAANTWEIEDSTIFSYDIHDNMVHEESYRTSTNLIFENDFFYSPLMTISTSTILERNNIKITPNPYQTFTPLKITGIENEPVINLQVFDLQGRMVFNNRFTNSQNIIINKELTSGMYIFNVSNKEGQTLKSQQVFIY